MTQTLTVVPPDVPNFLKDTIDLKKLLRAVSKESGKAIAVLVELLESKDEKTRLTAATRLLEFQVSVADKISQDQFSRLIGMVKAKALLAQTGPVPMQLQQGERPKPQPMVDFQTVREIPG